LSVDQYGVAGEAQGGIDLVARLAQPIDRNRPNLTVQCRNVTVLKPASIDRIVTDFLNGRWAASTEEFILATRAPLRTVKQFESKDRAVQSLAAAGVTFGEPWDGERLNELLRPRSELVEEFFGVDWADAFCVNGVPKALSAMASADPVLLGVHRAITVDGAMDAVPAYVRRDLESVIERLLADPSRGRLLLAIGSSSAGKTRLLYEVLYRLRGDWPVLGPSNVRELRVASRTLLSPTVIWLDEFAEWLIGGLSIEIVLHLISAGHVLVATMWPERYHAARVHPSSHGPDLLARQRRILELADVIHVDEHLSIVERSVAAALAVQDPRLEQALRSPLGMTQALAAAPQLLDRWRSAPAPWIRAVIDAAIDCRRVGVRTPLTGDLLRAAANGYMSHAQRGRAPAAWFVEALEYATEELAGAASVLRPLMDEAGHYLGYELADYLEQVGARARGATAVPAALWEALGGQVAESDRLEVSSEAQQRALRLIALNLLLPAAEPTASTHWSASWRAIPLLSDAGLEEEAAELRERVLKDSPFASVGWVPGESERVLEPVEWASARSRARKTISIWPAQAALARGDEDDARMLLEPLARDGNDVAARTLAGLLHRRDDATGALAWYLVSADLAPHDTYSLVRAASIHLALQNLDEAETLLAQVPYGGAEFRGCAEALAQGQHDRAIAVLTDRAQRWDWTVWWPWARLGADLHGHDVVASHMVNLTDGDDGGHGPLIAAHLWAEHQDLAKMRVAFERAAAAYCDVALTWSAAFDAETANLDESIRWLGQRLESGNPDAIWPWARMMQDAGRAEEARQRLMALARAGRRDAIWPSVAICLEQGRANDAGGLVEELLDRGELYALWPAGMIASIAGDHDEAIRRLLQAVECGDTAAVDEAGKVLSRVGRGDEAQRLQLYGIVPGGAISRRWNVPRIAHE
jgi:hypothetical protein